LLHLFLRQLPGRDASESSFLLFRIAIAPFGLDPLVLPTFSLGKTFGSAILSFEVVCRRRLKSGLIELVPCDFR
jgi:hypothetical protein